MRTFILCYSNFNLIVNSAIGYAAISLQIELRLNRLDMEIIWHEVVVLTYRMQFIVWQ